MYAKPAFIHCTALLFIGQAYRLGSFIQRSAIVHLFTRFDRMLRQSL